MPCPYDRGATEVNSYSEFWRWLWSDWGKPNFLTKAGVPRIAINLAAYVAYTFVIYFLAWKIASPPDRIHLSLATHSPLLLASWVVFYVSLTVDSFLSDRYGLKGLRLSQCSRAIWQSSEDVFVKISFISLGISLILFLAGALIFRHQMK